MKKIGQSLKMKKILGTFGKGVRGSLSFNWSASGGKNCDTNCRMHPDTKRADKIAGTPCYAMRLEMVYAGVKRSLQSREDIPPWKLCGMALVELQSLEARGVSIPWFRFSVDGSLPQPAEVRADKLDRKSVV